MTRVRTSGGGAFRSTKQRKGGSPASDVVSGGIAFRSSQAIGAPPSATFGPVRVLKYAVHKLKPWLDEMVSVGIGPWWISVDQAPEAFVYKGKQSDTRFTWGLTWSGDVMHEVIQPLDDLPSPYREFLDAGSEGLHHGAFYPRDYDGAIEELRRSGKKPIVTGHSGDARFVYFEGIGSPPQPIELQFLPEDVKAKHKVLKKASDNWDGTDPFRGPPRRWW